MSLGNRINEIRKAKGLSVDDLCDRSGIPKGTLSKITAGITTSPTLDTVKAIAKALECRLDDLDDAPKREDFLSANEQTHIKKYRLLDLYGQEAVDSVLDVESRRCQAEKAKTTTKLYIAARDGSRIEAEVDGELVIPEYDTELPE